MSEFRTSLLRRVFAGVLVFAPSVAFGQAVVTRGPYLQTVTPSSIIVKWRTDVATDSRVAYGDTPGNLISNSDDATSTTEHAVTVSGLSSDTLYFYSVGTTSLTLAGDDAQHSFKTAPPAGTAKPTRIWFLGDSGTADANAAAVRDAFYGFSGDVAPDFWVMLGDNAYVSGTDPEYQAAVFDMYPQTLRTSALWSALGNHDGFSANSSDQSGVYYDIFSFPKAGEAGGFASGTEAYYSFDYGDLHMICLDSFESDRSPGGPMMLWLTEDLSTTDKEWIIAFWHHPPYSKGSHNSDKESALIDMREVALPILEAGGVDLVLGGHSHSYERSYFLDSHYGTSGTLTNAMKVDSGDGRVDGSGAYAKPFTGTAGPHEGAVYIVAGSSGKNTGGSLKHPAMYASIDSLGSVIVDIDGSELNVTFLDNLGATLDYFTIIKGFGTPPDAPSQPTATAFSPTQIDLLWTDNSSNDNGFEVETSSDGFNWSPLVATGASVAVYADTGLTAATEHHYRVRAYNAFGDSAYSATATATTLDDGVVNDLADGESLIDGTQSGSYVDTQANDNVWESIQEFATRGKKTSRVSKAEHKWTVSVSSGSMTTLYVKAYHSPSSDGDDFVIAYSTDDATYINAITITKTVDDGLFQTHAFTSGVGGTLYLRLRDTNRSGGNESLDTLYVDQIVVRSVSGGGCIQTENPEVSCADGLDNDCDGWVDVDDPDCQAPSCVVDADCDDGVGCTDDACVANACVFSTNDTNCADDGLFCNGIEVCDDTLDCTSTGDPCSAELSCNESANTCDVRACQSNGAACTLDSDCCSSKCKRNICRGN